MSPKPLLQDVLDRIDEANALDPKPEPESDSHTPAALIYGRRMSAMLAELVAEPSELLQIAVRGQHIERWQRPRSDYPKDKAGYLQWRHDAAAFHAERVAKIMAECGWDGAAQDRVGSLIRKERLKSDAEAQTLEDVACLVFMRWYFVPFAADRSHDELFRIVAKTARKMSANGRKAALSLPLPDALVPAIADMD